jgi:ABC-type lipoprotein release transport system permease subunit
MFFTYLWRELRRRLRQAVLIALGLALGVGLVITVTAASDGVKASQATALIDKLAPKLTATVGASNAASVTGAGRLLNPGAAQALSGAGHSVSVTLSAPVTLGAIGLAVLLAVAGGLIAGSFGGWRAARLRPAAALARVA